MSVTTPAKQTAGNAANVFEQVPSDIFNKLSSSLLELTTVQREFAVVKDQLAQAKVELEEKNKELDQVNNENKSLRENISLLQTANVQKEQLSEYWKKECERTKEEMTDYIRRNEHKTNDSNNTNSTDMNNNTGEVVPNTKILDLINFLSKKYLQKVNDLQEDIGQKQLEVDRLTAENKLLALRINEKNELLKSWNEIADIWEQRFSKLEKENTLLKIQLNSTQKELNKLKLENNSANTSLSNSNTVSAPLTPTSEAAANEKQS
jgi:chromosome segregation ATPase